MKTLLECFGDFTSYCAFEKKLSPKSINFYGIDFNQFHEFLIKNIGYEYKIEDVDKFVIRQYIYSIHNFKPKTLKRKLATLKALFNYLEYEEIIALNPFRKLRTIIKEPLTIPRTMTISEVNQILKVQYFDLQNKKLSKLSRKIILRNLAYLICIVEFKIFQ